MCNALTALKLQGASTDTVTSGFGPHQGHLRHTQVARARPSISRKGHLAGFEGTEHRPVLLELTFNSTSHMMAPMSSQTTFGRRLRELRKAKNLTQRELAEKVADGLGDHRGFDFTYLSKIENDRTPPPSATAIVQLARVLETDADELLALAGKVPSDLGETLKGSEAARTFYRSALNADLTEDDWKKLRRELERRTRAREDHKKPED